jgi:two-component system cell cycle response regulator
MTMARILKDLPEKMPPPHRRRADLDVSGSLGLMALVLVGEGDLRAQIGTLLTHFGFEVMYAVDEAAAAMALDECTFDLAVIDFDLAGVNGLDFIATMRTNRRCLDAYALMLTDQGDVQSRISALRIGFDDFLIKSAGEDEMVAKIGAARRVIIRQRRLDRTVRELYGLATRDELTDVFNRRYFFAEAERLLAQRTKVSLVLFDFDDFKVVNDTYGHLAGDRMLRDIGTLFLRRTRHEDVIARYGGDEFVMLVTNCSLREVESIAARIAEEVSTLEWTFNGQQARITVTVGISSSELLAQPTVSELLHIGDRDLYKNKWVRAHPTVDPSLYEYPNNRANQISDLLEFPSRMPEMHERMKR